MNRFVCQEWESTFRPFKFFLIEIYANWQLVKSSVKLKIYSSVLGVEPQTSSMLSQHSINYTELSSERKECPTIVSWQAIDSVNFGKRSNRCLFSAFFSIDLHNLENLTQHKPNFNKFTIIGIGKTSIMICELMRILMTPYTTTTIQN